MSLYVVVYRKLKYVRTCFMLGLVVSTLLNTPVVCAFKFINNDIFQPTIRSSMNNFIPLFSEYLAVCVYFENKDVAYEFIEVYKTYNAFSILIVEEFDRRIIETCGGVVALGTNSYAKCDEMIKFLSTARTLLYFVNNTSMAVVSSLEACLSVAQVQEVLALSLSDSSVLQLSPVFPQPRHFVRTSVAEVMQRQDKPTKLKMKGATVTVAIMHYMPFIILKDESKTDLQLDDVDGIEALLLKELVQQLNLSVRLLVCDGWGVKLANGSWSGGIIQTFQDGTADLGFANLWQILSNYKMLDLGPSLGKVQVAFLVRRPEVIDFRWQSFLTIFKPQVWFGVLASFVVVVVAYWTGVQLDIHSWKQSWSSCLMTIFGYFIATYSQTQVREGNTRYTLTSWSVFSLLLTTALSSGIITRLVIPLYEDRVDSLQQLVEGKYYWTVEYYRDLSNDADFVALMFDMKNQWAITFEKTYKYMDAAEVAMKIKTDKKITFPAEIYGNELVIIDNVGLNGNEALNDFRMTKEELTASHVAIGIRKNSPLFEHLSVSTLNILEAGLMTHWKEDVVRRWPKCDTRHLLIEKDVPTFGEPHKLQLNKLQPVFYMLLLGCTVASCVFLVEILW